MIITQIPQEFFLWQMKTPEIWTPASEQVSLFALNAFNALALFALSGDQLSEAKLGLV